VSSKLYYAANMPEHDQRHIHAGLPGAGQGRLGAGTVYPCAVPGISLTDYSLSLAQKGWGPHCTGPFTTITLSNGVKLTCDSRVAELNTLVLNSIIRDGYTIRQSDTGCYNCRYIAGTTIWSNHAWGLAVDLNWTTNPQHSPLITDQPAWVLQRFNRYGYAWGGNYNPPTTPDAMHHEFMGTPAQAVAATDLARTELTGAAPPPPPVGGYPAPTRSPVTGNLEIPGFDCSYTKPGWMEMQAAGYTFMVGYVSPTAGKNLTAGNFYDYHVRAGMAVGLVWEATVGRALQGSSAGTADGKAAELQANAIGYPVDAVIFFAVDQDTTSASYPAIQAYANSFNLNTRRPVGIYGEADVIDHFVTPGVQPVRYGWQTAAWSAGRLSAKAGLYQRVGHPGWPVPATVAAGAFDEDVAISRVPLAGWQ
jgi:hypothetical protein